MQNFLIPIVFKVSYKGKVKWRHLIGSLDKCLRLSQFNKTFRQFIYMLYPRSNINIWQHHSTLAWSSPISTLATSQYFKVFWLSDQALPLFQTLLDLGASTNYKDGKGLTPLYYSVLYGKNAACAEMLLHERALIGTQDEQGWYEIHQVIQYGFVFSSMTGIISFKEICFNWFPGIVPFKLLWLPFISF